MSFSFGTPSSAPATGGLTSGFSFGTNKPATPGFGLTTSKATTGLFGSSTPSFGTATPAFGATSAAPAFGATSAAPAFGATTTPAFGATTTPAFGANTTSAFGTIATPAFGAASSTPAFGATSVASSFGTTTTTTPAFGLGTGLNFGAGSNTGTSTGLTFGTSAATIAKPGLGGLGSFGLGTNTTAQSTGLGLFGSTTTIAANSLFATTTVAGSQAVTSVTPSLGLGGVSTITSGIGAANTTTTDSKSEPPKQTKLPNEISTTVDTFKEFVKKQKALSSEVMRISIKPLHKVSQEAESTLRVALSLSGEVSKARAHSRRLRTAAAAALAAAETVARDIPGLGLEGNAPPGYVKELISELEQQLITLRRQMDVADKQMQASPKLLTEQELTLGIRRMHESLVALAGRLQAAHAQVEAQKEQYLNLRKYILKDTTNVFDVTQTSTSLDQILTAAEGTRKKSKTGSLLEAGMGSAVLSDPRAALGMQQLAGPTPFSYLGNSMSPFLTSDITGPNWQSQNQTPLGTSLNVSGFGATSTEAGAGFQLQKPPGKRTKQ